MMRLGSRSQSRAAVGVAAATLSWSASFAAEIRGTVQDEGSFPLPGAVVTVTPATGTGEVFRGTAGKNGSFVVADVPIGSYSLEAGLAGFVSVRYTPVEVSQPVLNWSFRLPIGPSTEGGVHSGAHLIGTLRGHDRKYPGAVVCLNDSQRRHCSTSNSLGEYDLTVDPGKYNVEVRLDGQVLWTQQLDVSRAGDYKDVIKP